MAAASVLLIAGVLAAADEGRRYVHQPGTISQPGEYRVSRDLSAVAGTALTVNADGVTLDLGGHLLTTRDPTAAVIRIVAGHTDVTVRNGVLYGGFHGILYDATSGDARLRIEQVRIHRSGDACVLLTGVGHVEFLRNVIRECGASAVHVEGIPPGSTGRFAANEIDQAFADGLYLFSMRAAEVRDNEVRRAGMGSSASAGIALTGDTAQPAGGNDVYGNRIADGQGTTRGIHVGPACAGNRVAGNVLTGNGGDGLLVASDGNEIVDNLVAAGGVDGIRVDEARNTLRGNQVVGNAREGIRVGGSFNLLHANLSQGNGSHGIWFDVAGANVYRDNMVRGNGSGAVGGSVNTDGGGNLP